MLVARRSVLLPLVTLAAAVSDATAQLARPGRRATATVELPAEHFQVVLPRPDVQRLLAEDRDHGDGPFRSAAVSTQGIAQHSIAIPDDPALAGVTLHTQALVFGTGSWRLTNAVRLHLR